MCLNFQKPNPLPSKINGYAPAYYRIYYEFPFKKVPLDYAGALHKGIYICIYRQGNQQYRRTIYLLALRRFLAGKGLPLPFISDNFQTFKAK